MNEPIALAFLREKLTNLNGRLYTTPTGRYGVEVHGLRYYLDAQEMARALARIPEYVASQMLGQRRKVA